MTTKLTTALIMADELVAALRDALAVADPVSSIILIQQIETACIIRSALGVLDSAIGERGAL